MSACPTPDKMGYPTRAAAKTHGKRVGQRYSVGGQLRPYRCVCGYWHLTHLSGKEATAARRKRRAKAARATA